MKIGGWMSQLLTGGQSSATKRGVALVVALLSAMAMYVAMATGPVSTANANHDYSGTFCSGWLAPSGQCDMGVGHATHHEIGVVYTHSRAGCIRWIGYYGEPVSGWECAGPWSGKAIYHGYVDAMWRASIKNNNNSEWGEFYGAYNTW